MTPRHRAGLTACLSALAVLALYTGAAMRLTAGYVVAALCAGAAVALLLPRPEDVVNQSEWVDADTWRDPDCIECGGDGAPCCEPPDHPYPGEPSGHEESPE